MGVSTPKFRNATAFEEILTVALSSVDRGKR
jgi:hypothetical protein